MQVGGWFLENMEPAPEIGTVAAVSPTTVTGLSVEDVKPRKIPSDYELELSRCQQSHSQQVEWEKDYQLELSRCQQSHSQQVEWEKDYQLELSRCQQSHSQHVEWEKAMAQEKALRERALQERAMQERALQERALQEMAMQERALLERVLQERATQERALLERALHEKVLQERALLERALLERALLERALQEKALQEKALQEKALQEKAFHANFPSTKRWEKFSRVGAKECVQNTSVKEAAPTETNENKNVSKSTVIEVIDLDTYEDTQEDRQEDTQNLSSKMSMALVMVPGQEKVPDHTTGPGTVKLDQAKTRKISSQSVHMSGPNRKRKINSRKTATNVRVARQRSSGNTSGQAAEADESVKRPRWPTSTVSVLSVQCARCRKWRVVPCNEKYEEIRQHISETPWVCEYASEWMSEVNCNDPPDLDESSALVWAMDKPNLPSAPPGWIRKIVIRKDCSTRFADVYYVTPNGKSLRSRVEVARYVEKNPGSVPPGTQLSQFSFTSPRPLPGVWVAQKTGKKKSVNDLSSQKCKKAKTNALAKQKTNALGKQKTNALAKQFAQKTKTLAKKFLKKPLRGAPHPALPVSSSSPLCSVESYPSPMGVSSQAGPASGPNLEHFVATLQSSSHPSATNFSGSQNVPFFSSPLPLRQCYPQHRQVLPFTSSSSPQQGIATSNSNAESSILGPAMYPFSLEHQQQRESGQTGAVPRLQPWCPPLRDFNGDVKLEP